MDIDITPIFDRLKSSFSEKSNCFSAGAGINYP